MSQETLVTDITPEALVDAGWHIRRLSPGFVAIKGRSIVEYWHPDGEIIVCGQNIGKARSLKHLLSVAKIMNT